MEKIIYDQYYLFFEKKKDSKELVLLDEVLSLKIMIYEKMEHGIVCKDVRKIEDIGDSIEWRIEENQLRIPYDKKSGMKIKAIQCKNMEMEELVKYRSNL